MNKHQKFLIFSFLIFPYSWGAPVDNTFANRALIDAYNKKNTDRFVFNLSHGANPNTIIDTKSGMTAFQWLVFNEEKDRSFDRCMMLLLANHSEEKVISYIDKKDREGNTGLHYAAYKGDPNTIRLLREWHSAAHLIKNNNEELPQDIYRAIAPNSYKDLLFEPFSSK